MELNGACSNWEDDAKVAEIIKALPSANRPTEPRGTYQCFHCGSYSVVWGNDFSFEDYGYDGDGIVHSCHCANCGADIEYRISLEDNND